MHNPRDILYGRLPRFRLSERGQQQALQTAMFLATRTIAALYTSPLLRARQTAHIITRYHPTLEPRTAEALMEVRTHYQGEPNSILKPGFSFYDPLLDPNDETIEQVRDRMLLFLQRLVLRHCGESIVAVSHADPIVITRLGLEQRPLTTPELHATVYPARASVNHIMVTEHSPPAINYFDVAGEQIS